MKIRLKVGATPLTATLLESKASRDFASLLPLTLEKGESMRGAVLYAPRDVRFEEREEPRITKPTDAIIRMSATCVCGSDLWPYRGIEPVTQPTPFGHEYCGIVEEVGSAVESIK